MSEPLRPASRDELNRLLAENLRDARQPVRPVGGGTAFDCGFPINGDFRLLETRQLNQVIDYPARDMTITVEAGIRLEDLDQVLRSENQQLPIDFGSPAEATLGGAIAANACGSRRFGYGSFRDYVIGITASTAAGEEFHSGGRVVKNVAGYDLCKLLVGSRGTLAIITEVTLKLKPRTSRQLIVGFAMPDHDELDLLLERLVSTDTRPVSLDVLTGERLGDFAIECPGDYSDSVLLVGFDGSDAEVEWQHNQLVSELAPFQPHVAGLWKDGDAERIWQELARFPIRSDAPAGQSAPVVQLTASLRPSATIEFLAAARLSGFSGIARAGNGVVELTTSELTSAHDLQSRMSHLQEQVRHSGGRIIVSQCPDDWKNEVPVWGPTHASWRLMSRIKQALDPFGLLNPGLGIDRELAQ